MYICSSVVEAGVTLAMLHDGCEFICMPRENQEVKLQLQMYQSNLYIEEYTLIEHSSDRNACIRIHVRIYPFGQVTLVQFNYCFMIFDGEIINNQSL